MHVDRRDLFSICILSLVFLLLAGWTLGITQAPLTTFQPTQGEIFRIELNQIYDIDSVYFLVKSGSITLRLSAGSPDNWSEVNNSTLKGYYSWEKVSVNRAIQFVKVDVEESSVEIVEMAVLATNNQKVAISDIKGEGNIGSELGRLVDEQDLVDLPPTYVSETFFDEIYFVRTAEEYLRLQHPYEWTHPPLGKLIIASGIVAFGYNPFGWRIAGVVFATLMIPLIYVFGKKLFGNQIGAFSAAFLLTFDFMHFTMARMATADTYVVFFSLASQLFFLTYLKGVLKNGWKTSLKPLFFAFLFFALGFSTKWLVIYGFAAQLAILAVLRLREVIKSKEGFTNRINVFLDHPFSWVFEFLVVAILIYFLIYIPDILAGRSVIEVLGLQGSMLNYHATLNATHAFSSAWWTWPLMLKPLWLYISRLPNGLVSSIALLGNPAVWWVGFISIINIVFHAIRRKNLSCIFIATFFFFQWLPYVLISRITFIYHFYVNVPFLCLGIAYFIDKYWRFKWMKVGAVAFFVLVAFMFYLFYGIISGAPTESGVIDNLKWLGSWIF